MVGIKNGIVCRNIRIWQHLIGSLLLPHIHQDITLLHMSLAVGQGDASATGLIGDDAVCIDVVVALQCTNPIIAFFLENDGIQQLASTHVIQVDGVQMNVEEREHRQGIIINILYIIEHTITAFVQSETLLSYLFNGATIFVILGMKIADFLGAARHGQ